MTVTVFAQASSWRRGKTVRKQALRGDLNALPALSALDGAKAHGQALDVVGRMRQRLLGIAARRRESLGTISAIPKCIKK